MLNELSTNTKLHHSVDRQDGIAKLLFFIIWPFGIWLYCLKYPKSRSSYLIFFLFSMLICWHMAPYITIRFDDFLGILERFNNNNITFDELSRQIKSYFLLEQNAPKEIYENILTCFVKYFTDNYHLFFLIASIPIAYCQLKSLKLMTDDSRFINGSWFGFWLIIMFIFPRDIITVQNPRFATGFWLCVFGALYYFRNRRTKLLYLIPILISPFCHSGLSLFLIIFVLVVFAPKNNKLWEITALCSIPFAFIDAGILNLIDIDLLPKNYQIWVSLYTSDNAIDRFVLKTDRAGFWWVQASFELFMKCMYFVMTFQMISYKRKNLKDRSYNNIYIFYLILFAIVNVIQFVPELGARYFWFVRVICVYLWFKMFGETKKKTLYLLVIACSFLMFMRYGYIIGGALSVTTNPDIFLMPLPYLLGKGLFWDL